MLLFLFIALLGTSITWQLSEAHVSQAEWSAHLSQPQRLDTMPQRQAA